MGRANALPISCFENIHLRDLITAEFQFAKIDINHYLCGLETKNLCTGQIHAENSA